MTTDIKELVKRLRERYSRRAAESNDEARLRRQLERDDAADALEAMAGEVEAYESARVTWAESMRAWINRATVAERERDRLKAALKLWQDAWATGRNEPMAIAANVTRYELGGDA